MKSVTRISLALCAIAVAACGLSQSGLMSVDAGADVLQVCSTLDAACLGPLDSTWTPVTIGSSGCVGGYSPLTLVKNPSVPPGGCACGACTMTGSLSCEAGTPIAGGDNNCGDPPMATVPAGICAPAHAQHLIAQATQATPGSVGCSVSNDAGLGAAADDVIVCIPDCSSDFCGAAQRCAMAEGAVACPAGMKLFATAGESVDPGCAPCACAMAPFGSCDGIVTAYESQSCDDAGLVHSYPVGTCNVFDTKTDYSSVFVSLTPPAAGCMVTTPTIAGDASLVGLKTICCL